MPLNAAHAADRPVPVRDIIEKVRIPYEAFTLPNGLRVLVHTDRKAPVVALSVWYDVGSKQEPAGKTGFAHLFEHLMFNGSEHAPGTHNESLAQLGATGVNGSTWFDRTNYYETVPTPALARALFLESDRMGYLLGAITQTKLDQQRGVVQNEKRQGENGSFGLVEQAQIVRLFPKGHPYAHTTIGSMADLDAASLDDVKAWFRAHYGPNNAILVLAGDIDVATARPMVERYFANIPRGPAATAVSAPIPTLAARVNLAMKDRVATTRLYRTWVVPGLNNPDTIPLTVGASILGGLSSSRLVDTLVRKEKLATAVSAGLEPFAQMSQLEVTVDVAPGVDPAIVSKRLDALIADLLDNGPSRAEVTRAATQAAADQVRALESNGGTAATLAAGLLYSDDPEHYRKDLMAYADATPEKVHAALRRWLSRPVLAISVAPGPREAEEAGSTQPGIFRPQPATASTRAPQASIAPLPVSGTGQPQLDRSHLPDIGPIADLQFPAVTHVRLSNGIELVYAHRVAVPMTRVALSFDAGFAADPREKLGTASLMAALMEEGTTHLPAIAIAQREEELGANIAVGSSLDRTVITLGTLSDNLAPSLDLFADIALNPAFAATEVERLRGLQLARIGTELTSPRAITSRVLMPLLYGPDHPYGIPGTGTGYRDTVARITRDDLVAFHRAWLRPDKATIFVVSDRPLAEVQAQFEARFGQWSGQGAAGVKHFDVPVPPAQPHIVLVDRKDSPQSVIVAGEVLPQRGTDDMLDLETANEVLGGSFTSRINTDLRQSKGWSYGVSARMSGSSDRIAYTITAPVQSDQTGPSITALLSDYKGFLTTDGITGAELERTRNGDIRELPGAFETGAALLRAMQTNAANKRPDSYYTDLPERYRRQTAAQLDQAARAAIKPDQLLWVVVGDAAKVKPQLDALGLPVELVTAR